MRGMKFPRLDGWLEPARQRACGASQIKRYATNFTANVRVKQYGIWRIDGQRRNDAPAVYRANWRCIGGQASLILQYSFCLKAFFHRG
jgi:hypothetical protein